jgi:hypothetical protein
VGPSPALRLDDAAVAAHLTLVLRPACGLDGHHWNVPIHAKRQSQSIDRAVAVRSGHLIGFDRLTGPAVATAGRQVVSHEQPNALQPNL